jgi:hypothetical protein
MLRIFALVLILVSQSTSLASLVCPAAHHEDARAHSDHTPATAPAGHAHGAAAAATEAPAPAPTECLMSAACGAPAAPAVSARALTAPVTAAPYGPLIVQFYTDPAQHIDRPPPRRSVSA